MPRKSRSPKTGRSTSPIKNLTVTNRGPGQFQARFRKTGYPVVSATFATLQEAHDWGLTQAEQAMRGVNRELRQANEILRKASAYFAMAPFGE
jgi:hypothetical protein